MRRIPRPQRAIEPSLPIPSLARHRATPPSCLRSRAPYTCLRTTSAAFSTTPTSSFLFSGKQDKKKHQQFVRRWQKRLVGDAEPIGAHVDPYDPTSPVRIAPEEQGEEVEVLEDEDIGEDVGPLYKEAETAQGLRHVGGKAWVEQMEEANMAREFEKLTLRTYTPLTAEMALQIEELTGSLFTLRDENFPMGQTFEEATGKPYTELSFGPWKRVRDPDSLRKNFHRAVVEIYALKQAKKSLDLSQLANKGIYEAPEWIQDVQLQRRGTCRFGLTFPKHHSLKALLERIKQVPEYPPEQEAVAEEELWAEEGEQLEAEQPEPPTMDPDTPPARRAALVVQDPDKKPFDFMSNRPAPRTQHVQPPAEPTEKVEATATVPSDTTPTSTSQSPAGDVATKVEATGAAVAEMRYAFLESAARSAAWNVAALRREIRDSVTAMVSKSTTTVPASEVEVKWRQVPIEDAAVKFAITKRVTQLTGLYISDPHLSSANTLGDLYHSFCAAAKPKPAKLFDFIKVEGLQQNRKADRLVKDPTARQRLSRKKPGVGELLKLPNVEIHRKRVKATKEFERIGLQKVIGEEMQKHKYLSRRLEKEMRARSKEGRMVEGTRLVPEFGVPVPPTSAQLLRDRTVERRREWMEKGIDADAFITQRNRLEPSETV